jgi:hypothetical protein
MILRKPGAFHPAPARMRLGRADLPDRRPGPPEPEGDYVFVSRKDYQVKWMGYRIGWLRSSSTLTHPQVRDTAVLLVDLGKDGLTELVAFFEAEGDIDSSSPPVPEETDPSIHDPQAVCPGTLPPSQ